MSSLQDLLEVGIFPRRLRPGLTRSAPLCGWIGAEGQRRGCNVLAGSARRTLIAVILNPGVRDRTTADRVRAAGGKHRGSDSGIGLVYFRATLQASYRPSKGHRPPRDDIIVGGHHRSWDASFVRCPFVRCLVHGPALHFSGPALHPVIDQSSRRCIAWVETYAATVWPSALPRTQDVLK